MKAKFVYENMEFERGQDPKDAMGIGSDLFRYTKILDKFAEKWGFKESHGMTNYHKKWIRNPEDVITIRKSKRSPSGVSIAFISQDNYIILSEKKYLQRIKEESFWKNLYGPKILESMEFERGQDPKDAMGIGKELYRNNKRILTELKEKYPEIQSNLELSVKEISEDLEIKLISIKEAGGNKIPGTYRFWVTWENKEGGKNGSVLYRTKDGTKNYRGMKTFFEGLYDLFNRY